MKEEGKKKGRREWEEMMEGRKTGTNDLKEGEGRKGKEEKQGRKKGEGPWAAQLNEAVVIFDELNRDSSVMPRIDRQVKTGIIKHFYYCNLIFSLPPILQI